MKLKIVAISDLHGILPEIIESADIMIIAGDIVPLNIQRDKPESKYWFEHDFAEWIEQLPVDEVFMIAGNHDFYLENITEDNLRDLRIACKGKLHYLCNEKAVYVDSFGQSWNIFGTPYCHEFGRWAFMLPDSKLTDKFREIPEIVDIIISHDPPYFYGDCDIVMENFSKLWTHLGNKPLAQRLHDVDYKILFCGHIHSGDHDLNDFYNTVNVSILNERYNESYKPFYTLLSHD